MAEGQTTISGDMVCANNDLAGSCIGALQIDKVFEYVPAASGNVTFTVTTSADLAPGLFVTDACGGGAELACTASGVLTLPVTKGTSIFVGLEALPIGSGPRTYSIVADLVATNPSNKCAAGIPVTSLVVDNAVLLLATTAGSGADIPVPTQAGQCTAAQFPDPAAGNDLVFAVKPTQSGTLTLKAKAENPKVLDPVLYVTSTCGDSTTSIKCANSSGVGGIETFSVAVTADTVYYAVIDSAGGTAGDVSFTALLTVPLGVVSPTPPQKSAWIRGVAIDGAAPAR